MTESHRVWVFVRWRGDMMDFGGVYASYEDAKARLHATIYYDTEDGKWEQDTRNIYKWWRGREFVELVEQGYFEE